jgi:hypothetical protein
VRRGAGDVEVAIDPAELEGLDEEGVRALYEERLAQQRAGAPAREVRAPWRSLLPHADSIGGGGVNVGYGVRGLSAKPSRPRQSLHHPSTSLWRSLSPFSPVY